MPWAGREQSRQGQAASAPQALRPPSGQCCPFWAAHPIYTQYVQGRDNSMLPRHHGILQNFQGTLWFSSCPGCFSLITISQNKQ